MAKNSRKGVKMKFDYDPEIDDLFIYYSNSKSKGSIEIGDIILDLNSKKELVGIELLNASKFIDNKEILKGLKECKLEIRKQNGWMILKLKLIGKNKEIEPIINIPLIN